MVIVEILGTGISNSTNTDRFGNFYVDLVAPFAPGNYTVKIIITDYTYTGIEELSLEVENFPDFYFGSPADISVAGDRSLGSDIVVSATVRNAGDYPGWTNVSFYRNGDYIGQKEIC